METSQQKHDYHLVDPSPWPIVGALGVFVMLGGAVLWLNKSYAGFGVLAGIPWIFAIGLALVVFTMLGWWRDVAIESVVRHEHTPLVKLGFRYGIVLVILADAMFLIAWAWARFHFSLFPDAGLKTWPPAGVTAIDPWGLPFLGTVLLLTSVTTMNWARRAIALGDRRATILALAMSAALAAGFLVAENQIFRAAPFHFGLNGASASPAAIYGSTFFMLVGLHGLHIFAGAIFLLVCLTRAVAGHFTPTRHFGFVAAAWFWNFAVSVWLLLFVSVFVLGL